MGQRKKAPSASSLRSRDFGEVLDINPPSNNHERGHTPGCSAEWSFKEPCSSIVHFHFRDPRSFSGRVTEICRRFLVQDIGVFGSVGGASVHPYRGWGDRNGLVGVGWPSSCATLWAPSSAKGHAHHWILPHSASTARARGVEGEGFSFGVHGVQKEREHTRVMVMNFSCFTFEACVNSRLVPISP